MFRNLPYYLHGPLSINDVEGKETALEVVLQGFGHCFDELSGHLSHSHSFEIDYSYPVLDLPWDQGARNHELGHVSRHIDECFMIGLDPLEFVNIDVAYGPHFPVAFVYIGVALVELLEPYFKHRDFYRERLREFVMLNY